MSKNKYYLTIGPKTRFLNFFRSLFRITPIENFLLKRVIGRSVRSVWVRLMPPNYVYPKNSRREVNRMGINYSLDISDQIEHAVYFGYKDEAQDALLLLARDKNVIIDVGVNIGASLLNFARVSPDALVIGFEPDIKNLRKAERNLSLNDFSNIKIIGKGLGEMPALVKLFKVNDGNEGMNRILDETRLSVDMDIPFDEVEIITLDDFSRQNQIGKIDLIKIDVEGYELRVLKGAERTLMKYSPTLFIELDDENLKEQGDSPEHLIRFLERYGYRLRRAGGGEPVHNSDNFDKCHFDIICEPHQTTLTTD